MKIRSRVAALERAHAPRFALGEKHPRWVDSLLMGNHDVSCPLDYSLVPEIP
jgi:hypothetical protein